MKTTNEAFLSKFHNALLSKSRFVKACIENGLEITELRLSFYEQEGLMCPIAVYEDETFYSPFQLFRIYILEDYVSRSLSKIHFIQNEDGVLIQKSPFEIKRVFDLNRDNILYRDEDFYRIVSILHHIQPFYSNPYTITSYLRELTLNPRDLEDPNWFVEKRRSGFIKEVIESHSVDAESIRFWQQRISSAAEDIDPLDRWYHLLRNLGPQDKQKLKWLHGSAKFAQFLYRMEEVLRGALEDLVKEKTLNPSDIRDLTGGSWRIAKDEKGEEIPCIKCGMKPVELRSLATRHQGSIMCRNCTREFFFEMDESQDEGTIRSRDPNGNRKPKYVEAQTPLICDNVMCGKDLSKQVPRKTIAKCLNEGLVIDETRGGLLAIELLYGEMTLRIKCGACKHITMRDISIGWDTSHDPFYSLLDEPKKNDLV